MQNIFSSIANNLDVFIPILLVSLALVVIYLVFIVRTVIDMLQYDVQGVLLTFAFIALIPLPPLLVTGIVVMIIWHYHKKHLLKRKRQSLPDATKT